MVRIEIGENEAGQRVDRYLRKTLKNAPLSRIYSLLRKDIKINGKRGSEGYILRYGDLLTAYLLPEEWDRLKGEDKKPLKRAKKQFSVVYEDEKLLIANKPFGLLTHGDKHEKENTLANQVLSYLAEKGEYDPRRRESFTPSPANRLDRNTTGLVVFGKNAAALRELNRMIRERSLHKYYLTIVHGKPEGERVLEGTLSRVEGSNRSVVRPEGGEKDVRTRIRPLESRETCGEVVTIIEAELLTGRTHQIRAQLAAEGYPLLGDVKYASKRQSEFAKRHFGLTTQLLFAYKLEFEGCEEPLKYMEGKAFEARPGKRFEEVRAKIFV